MGANYILAFKNILLYQYGELWPQRGFVSSLLLSLTNSWKTLKVCLLDAITPMWYHCKKSSLSDLMFLYSSL